MKNRIAELRRARGIGQLALAEAAGVSTPQVSKWETGRVDIPQSRLATIARVLGTSIDELFHKPGSAADADPVPEPNAVPFKMEGASAERMQENLPIYGTALGAAREVDGDAIEQAFLNTAEVVSFVRRPTILNGNAAAYGLYVSGSSMEPRFFDGETLLADPNGRVRGGEDVVVYLRPQSPIDDDGERARAVLVKRLVRRTSTYVELEQYTPAKRFRIEMEQVVRIDRVLPWGELLG